MLSDETGRKLWRKMPFCNPFPFHSVLFIVFMGRMISKYEIISFHSQVMAGVPNHELSTNWWACIK